MGIFTSWVLFKEKQNFLFAFWWSAFNAVTMASCFVFSDWLLLCILLHINFICRVSSRQHDRNEVVTGRVGVVPFRWYHAWPSLRSCEYLSYHIDACALHGKGIRVWELPPRMLTEGRLLGRNYRHVDWWLGGRDSCLFQSKSRAIPHNKIRMKWQRTRLRQFVRLQKLKRFRSWLDRTNGRIGSKLHQNSYIWLRWKPKYVITYLLIAQWYWTSLLYSKLVKNWANECGSLAG